jgi:hypothetical protein
VQNANHERASELSVLQRQWEMLDAANAQARAVAESHLPGVPNMPLDPKRQRRALEERRAAEHLASAKGAKGAKP